jgi:hypothetical protein
MSPAGPPPRRRGVTRRFAPQSRAREASVPGAIPVHNSDYTHGTAAPEGSPGNSRCRARDWECARRAPGPGHDCGAHPRAPSSDGDVPAHSCRRIPPGVPSSAPRPRQQRPRPRPAAAADDSEREGHRDGHARLRAPQAAHCRVSGSAWPGRPHPGRLGREAEGACVFLMRPIRPWEPV